MEISRFPCKRLLRMPGSTTTRGRHVSCDIDTGRVAFCGTENISTPNLSYAAQYLACALPCERFTSALADNPCITRGQCGSLLLHRDGLPPSTFCRSPGAPVATLKQATSVIPIVFAIAGDPVGSGFVESLARPGGNITGMSLQQHDIASKRIELLRDVVPNLGRLAILFNAGYPASVFEAGEVQAAAHTLGLEVASHEIRRAEDIAPVFETLKSQADALYVVDDTLIIANRTSIITLALGARLPTIFGNRDYVQAGALMSYGPNYPALFRRAADFVDKILRGTKPADIPVEQPTIFGLVVNLTTAKALGLTIPPSFLSLADELVE